MEDLHHDWKLACMHFPFYVAMWFGTTPDENLVDPDFPRRFVPRAFDAVLRNGAHLVLPKPGTLPRVPSGGTLPPVPPPAPGTSAEALQKELAAAKITIA